MRARATLIVAALLAIAGVLVWLPSRHVRVDGESLSRTPDGQVSVAPAPVLRGAPRADGNGSPESASPSSGHEQPRHDPRLPWEQGWRVHATDYLQRPVAGARVFLHSSTRGGGASVGLFLGETDAMGVCECFFPDLGLASFRAEDPHTGASGLSEAVAEGSTAEIRLHSGQSLRVCVRDVHGAPVTLGIVHLMSASLRTPRLFMQAPISAEGCANFRSIRPGAYHCSVFAPGYRFILSKNIELPPLPSQDVTITLGSREELALDVVAPEDTCVNTITLHTAPGRVMSDVPLLIERNSRGYFSVPYPPALGTYFISSGEYTAVITFAGGRIEGAVESGGVHTIHLTRGATLRGRVIGLPAGAAARVELVCIWCRGGHTDSVHKMARVDSSGSFSFSSVVPGAILVAKAKLPSAYYAEPWVLTTYEPDDELVCEIQARSAARLNVLVRDSRGSAVAGAILTWEDALESAGLSAPVLSALASPHVAVTGDAGCAEISGRPGAAVRLDVRHGSYADRLGMYPVLHEGDRPLEILLLAETRIDGTVVGIDGGVVPGAVVTAHFRVNDVEGAPYEEIARAIADQNGEFALVFSEFNSPIQLRAQHGGARAERRWERGDDTQVRLTIP